MAILWLYRSMQRGDFKADEFDLLSDGSGNDAVNSVSRNLNIIAMML